jgi:heptosyltransferase-1
LKNGIFRMPAKKSPKSILLVKTSSLGDVIHNLPVATDLAAAFPGVALDWVAESAFAGIPGLHPAVREVLPVSLRKWRKHLFAKETRQEIAAFKAMLKSREYDYVLDTQGLIKSAWVAKQANGRRLGFDRASIREKWAARAYDEMFAVPKGMHAVLRNRALAAAAFGYMPGEAIDYGLGQRKGPAGDSVVFLTASSREGKQMPASFWINLGRALAHLNLVALLPAGSPDERREAARIAEAVPYAQAIPPMSLPELANLLFNARFSVGVDPGLTQLSVAVGTPTLALFKASDPGLTGVLGSTWHQNLGAQGKPPGLQDVLDALAPLLFA